MASAKRTPKVSRISRDRTVAYARKQKSTADGGDGGGSEADEPETAGKDTAGVADPAPIPPPAPSAGLPSAGPWPDATPPPTKPVDPERARVNTVAMPVQTSLGAPPELPRPTEAVAAVAVDVSAAEDPTRMPGPREIPGGHPDDPAPPPGAVPRGDSRSMRRRTDRDEFALIYRIQSYVITRVGNVGTRGQWRVVEYPTSVAASHAYAKECSRFASEGFSDYRG